MNAEEFKEITGVSVDDIVSEAVSLLNARRWEVTDEGVRRNVSDYIRSKDKKIREMVKSPYYNGNLQLVIPITMTRETDQRGAKGMLNVIANKIDDIENIFIDGEGKQASDYISKGVGIITDFSDIKSRTFAEDICVVRSKFHNDLKAKDTSCLIDHVKRSLHHIYYSAVERVSENTADYINSEFGWDKKKVVAGQKTSKVIMRLLNMLQSYTPYNEEFTKLADYLNSRADEKYYVVSLNFLDYLRMSDGNSWASCHTTDPENTRQTSGDHYHGAYCQGTLSYALDEATYITYVVDKDADTKHPDRSDKILRNCVHSAYDHKQIIQGRVYPQSNDGKTNLYDTMWGWFLKAMQLENVGYRYIGSSSGNALVDSYGAHYRDYEQYDDPRLYLAPDWQNRYMSIGSEAYSCRNGDELDPDIQDTIV